MRQMLISPSLALSRSVVDFILHLTLWLSLGASSIPEGQVTEDIRGTESAQKQDRRFRLGYSSAIAISKHHVQEANIHSLLSIRNYKHWLIKIITFRWNISIDRTQSSFPQDNKSLVHHLPSWNPN
ncbi:hypothetical protein F4804DRAFT_61843 [Jackrogersella minutella]|nr:hypothetical protein F4804DRAFT_61843 [Jackrogersella minutella]